MRVCLFGWFVIFIFEVFLLFLFCFLFIWAVLCTILGIESWEYGMWGLCCIFF